MSDRIHHHDHSDRNDNDTQKSERKTKETFIEEVHCIQYNPDKEFRTLNVKQCPQDYPVYSSVFRILRFIFVINPIAMKFFK